MSRSCLSLALALTLVPLAGCSKDASSGAAPAASAASSATPAPSASASASPPLEKRLDLPPPPAGYSPVPLGEPNLPACTYFGGGSEGSCKQLQMIAAYGNGAGRTLRVYRVVDPATGDPMVLKKWKFYGHVDKLPDGTSRLELDDGKAARFWVVKTSVVIEGEEPSAQIEPLRAAFTEWAIAMIPLIAGK